MTFETDHPGGTPAGWTTNPQGSVTQPIGIVPDVEVRPTIEGIRAGRDEVLEAGIREILGPSVPAAEIQKMIPAANRIP